MGSKMNFKSSGFKTSPIKTNFGSSSDGVANALEKMMAMQQIKDQADQQKLQTALQAGGRITSGTAGGMKFDLPTPASEDMGKEIPQNTMTTLNEGGSTAKDLISNANTVMDNPSIKNQMGPLHPSAYMNGFGNLAMNVRAAINRFQGKSNKDVQDFAQFKSSTGDIFQRYRKFLDGVRASVGGSKLETPIFPQSNADPDIFISQTLGVLKNMETNYKTVAETLKGQGYRTGGISDIFPTQGTQDLRSKVQSSDTTDLENELRQMYMPGKK